jgi:hypothetical protein
VLLTPVGVQGRVSDPALPLHLCQVKIEKPPPQEYEMRVIVWRADKVRAMDTVRRCSCCDVRVVAASVV